MGSPNRPEELASSADLDGAWRVLEAFEHDVWDEIHLVTGDFEIHLSRDGIGVDATHGPEAAKPEIAVPHRSAQHSASAEAIAEAAAGAPVMLESTAGLLEITAPSVGIFWAQPQPGAPAFVSIDDTVQPGTTVCIIEVMKLMNHVKASAHGRIVRVLGVNGQAVERGQPLFLVEPAA